MKKLEDIPKKSPFSVPDGYFDTLPGVIQARVAEGNAKERVPYLRYALQYAIPAVVLLVAAIFYLKPDAQPNYTEILASVDTEQMAAYLADTEITTDDILDAAELDDESILDIETEVYFNDIDLNNLDLEL